MDVPAVGGGAGGGRGAAQPRSAARGGRGAERARLPTEIDVAARPRSVAAWDISAIVANADLLCD